MNETVPKIKIMKFTLPDKTSFIHANSDVIRDTYEKILLRKDSLTINDTLYLFYMGVLCENKNGGKSVPIIDIEKDFGKSPFILAKEFFQSVNGGNLCETYSAVASENKSYFWDLYIITETYTGVRNEQFKTFLSKQEHSEISFLRSFQELLNRYTEAFVSVLLSDYHYLPDIIELLWPSTNSISQPRAKLEEKHFTKHKSSLHQMVNAYIEMCKKDANQAHLLEVFIGNKKIDKFFELTIDELDEIRDLYMDYFSSLHQISQHFEYIVKISDEFENDITINCNKDDSKNGKIRIFIKINPNKLQKNLKEKFELLLVQILFNPASMHFSLADNDKSSSVFEKVLHLIHEGEYTSYSAHQAASRSAICLFSVIRDISSSSPSSCFENLLFKYINDHIMSKIGEDEVQLKSEYNPEAKSVPISTLYISIETMIKTFYLFGTHVGRKVSQKELDYEDKLADFKNIKSVTPLRHATLNKENSKAARIMDILFSDLYIKNETDEYFKTMFEWILKCGDISLLSTHDMKLIEELRDAKLFQIQNNNLIVSKAQLAMLAFLRNLHEDESVTFSSYIMPDFHIEAIQNLLEGSFITLDNNLFTQKECDYLDYMLNNKRFTNSLALRNKYCHNSSHCNKNIFDDYISGLIILSFAAVSISKDLQLKEEMDEITEVMKETKNMKIKTD